MSFEVKELTFLDPAISLLDKCTLRELILNLKGLSDKNKLKNIFILVEKDCKENIILLFRKKFHKDVSTITVYLSIVIAKQYGDSILLIFELYFQDLAKDVIWINRIPITKEEKDLEDALGEELD